MERTGGVRGERAVLPLRGHPRAVMDSTDWCWSAGQEELSLTSSDRDASDISPPDRLSSIVFRGLRSKRTLVLMSG